MKRTALLTILAMSLLFSAWAGRCIVRMAQAHPYMYHEWVSPPPGSIPLTISVASPKNNTVCNVSDVTFIFNITTEDTDVNYLLGAYYQANWMSYNVTVYKQDTYSPEFPANWDWNENFRQIPDGEYSINITCWGGGGYAEGLTYNYFDMTTISTINFAVDTIRPAVWISIENKTYDKTDLPLSFATDEAVSQVSYVLDGQKNIAVDSSTTLRGLSAGAHNITFYATDIAGNTGSTEMLFFSVFEPEPFPTEPVAVAMVGVIILAVTGLSVYFKKRQRK